MSASHRAYHFDSGQLVPAEPPAWFIEAIADGNDWQKSLSQAGAIEIETFDDGGERIYSYEGPDGSYFVGFWNVTKCFAEFFIDNADDYLKFRADYIAPFAKLIIKPKRVA